EIDAVGPFVGTGTLGEFYLAARDNRRHDFGEVPNLIVVGGLADIERFIADVVGGSLERRNKRAGDILDVDDGSPGRAIRLQMNLSCRERPGNKIVKDDVEA